MGILVVDPNVDDLSFICRFLNMSGYNDVFPFSSIREAEQNLHRSDSSALKSIFAIDIAIIDVSSGQPAYHFLEKMRRSAVYQDLPILAISDGNRSEAMSSSFAYGATDFLSKSIDEYELKARVRVGIKLKYEIERRKARERELIEVTNQLTDLNEILSNLSLIDSLTGIANRRCFDDSLSQEWRRAVRHGGDLTLIMIDVDHFKRYNDSYGHQMGDKCLVDLTRTINLQLRRPGDMLARYGGEEFAIILPNTAAWQTDVLCSKIQKSIENLHIPHESSPSASYVTISMGVASTNPAEGFMDSARLLQAADEALYIAKAKGRNTFVINAKKSFSA